MNKEVLRRVGTLAVLICLCGTAARAEESLRLTRPGMAGSSQPSTQSSGGNDSSSTAPSSTLNNGSTPLQMHVEKTAVGAGVDDEARGGQSLTGKTAGSAPIQMHVEKNTTSTAVRLSAGELATLGEHDLVLCIDKSSSMSTMDCPSLVHPGYAVSRWQWCGEQTMDLAQQASTVLPEGMSVVLFSWVATPFAHVDVKQIPLIFMNNQPNGITNAGMALNLVLSDYFVRKQKAPDKVRPMIVAIITDGLPTNPFEVKDAIFRATVEMKRPDELHFTFLQIGQDPEGVAFIRTLDQDLLGHGAKYDVVTSKTFDKLLKTGLAKAIVDCLEPKSKQQ